MTKNQFYFIWIIFGAVAYYGFHQVLRLLAELIVSIEIALNVNPKFLMYSQTFWYLIIILIFLLVAIKILRTKSSPVEQFDFKKLRISLSLIIILGLGSQLLTRFITKHRLDTFIPYLENHKLNPSDYYSKYLWLPTIPNIIIFISALIIFFALTKKVKS